jgi:hypothetical protein
MSMICIVSLPSLVRHCWGLFVLFHFMLRWFIFNGIVCIASLPSLVHHCSMPTMRNNEEPRKHEVEQYNPSPVKMDQ